MLEISEINSQTARDLKNRHDQFEALFNYATIGIVVTDHLGTIINFNKYAENQFGYKKEEVNGRPVEILLPQSLHRVHTSHRADFYEHPEPRRMGEGRDLFALKKDGTQFPVEVSLSHYSTEEETYVIAFVIDITVRKRSEALVRKQNTDLEKGTSDMLQLNAELEQKVDDRTVMLRETLVELERSRKELNEALIAEKELSDLKYRFVTAASHEFRTPLSTILSSAYILGKYKNNEFEDKKEKHILRIKKAVEGMKGILEDFLSLGKLEEGKVQVRMEEMEAVECIAELRSAIGEMEHLLKKGQQIHLHHEINRSDFYIDRHMLKSIFINLVSNAIKFSGEGTFIEIVLLFSEESFTLSVKDSGIGIPKEDQIHLFDRFFRAGNASNIQGSGLGLHIIGKYLELLNGKIEINSSLHDGSLFIVSFPQQTR
jgi:PAS domain S-box-containing protein